MIFFPAWLFVVQSHFSFTSLIRSPSGRTIIVHRSVTFLLFPSSRRAFRSVHSCSYFSSHTAFASIRAFMVYSPRQHLSSTRFCLSFFMSQFYFIASSSLRVVSFLHHNVFNYRFIIMLTLPQKQSRRCRLSAGRPFSNALFTVADHSTSTFRGSKNDSRPEQDCSSQHASSVVTFLSHPSQPVHLEKAVSDNAEVVSHAPSVANYFSPHSHQLEQSSKVRLKTAKSTIRMKMLFSAGLFLQLCHTISMTIPHRKRKDAKRSRYRK